MHTSIPVHSAKIKTTNKQLDTIAIAIQLVIQTIEFTSTLLSITSDSLWPEWTNVRLRRNFSLFCVFHSISKLDPKY